LLDHHRPAQVNGRCRLLAYDPAPRLHNLNNSPVHIIGVRTPVAKLGVHADRVPDTTNIAPRTVNLEYYDSTTPGVSGYFGCRDRNQGPERDQKFESADESVPAASSRDRICLQRLLRVLQQMRALLKDR